MTHATGASSPTPGVRGGTSSIYSGSVQWRVGPDRPGPMSERRLSQSLGFQLSRFLWFLVVTRAMEDNTDHSCSGTTWHINLYKDILPLLMVSCLIFLWYRLIYFVFNLIHLRQYFSLWYLYLVDKVFLWSHEEISLHITHGLNLYMWKERL